MTRRQHSELPRATVKAKAGAVQQTVALAACALAAIAGCGRASRRDSASSGSHPPVVQQPGQFDQPPNPLPPGAPGRLIRSESITLRATQPVPGVGIGDNTVVFGDTQGGHAALFAGRIAAIPDPCPPVLRAE